MVNQVRQNHLSLHIGFNVKEALQSPASSKVVTLGVDASIGFGGGSRTVS